MLPSKKDNVFTISASSSCLDFVTLAFLPCNSVFASSVVYTESNVIKVFSSLYRQNFTCALY